MKINVDVFREGDSNPFTTIHDVKEIYFYVDHDDLVIQCLGRVPVVYLKKPFSFYLFFKVEEDNCE